MKYRTMFFPIVTNIKRIKERFWFVIKRTNIEKYFVIVISKRGWINWRFLSKHYQSFISMQFSRNHCQIFSINFILSGENKGRLINYNLDQISPFHNPTCPIRYEINLSMRDFTELSSNYTNRMPFHLRSPPENNGGKFFGKRKS